MHIELLSQSEQQTRAVARQLAQRLRGGEVIALEGELGAGKTVFVRGLAEGLGIASSNVSSPTFVIRQEYTGEIPATPTLVHIDAYRLAGPEDLEAIGWSEVLQGEGLIIAVEWPSRIASELPEDRIEVRIVHAGRTARHLTLAVPPSMADRIEGIALQPTTPRGRAGTQKCRTCGRPVDPHSPTFPFCSERCKLADLGKWFDEGYRVSREMEADEELED